MELKAMLDREYVFISGASATRGLGVLESTEEKGTVPSSGPSTIRGVDWSTPSLDSYFFPLEGERFGVS